MCALPNLTNSEWAAWVQAFGTIAAIVAAALIASHQYRTSLRRDKDADEQRMRQVARHCVAFGTHLVECVAELQRSLVYENTAMARRQHSRLQDLAQFAQSINLSGLPADSVIAFLNLRSIAAQALSDAHGALEAGWEGSPPSLQNQFERHLNDASKAAHALHDQLEALLPPEPQPPPVDGASQ